MRLVILRLLIPIAEMLVPRRHMNWRYFRLSTSCIIKAQIALWNIYDVLATCPGKMEAILDLFPDVEVSSLDDRPHTSLT